MAHPLIFSVSEKKKKKHFTGVDSNGMDGRNTDDVSVLLAIQGQTEVNISNCNLHT